MAYDLKKEEDVKEYLKNLGIEYRFGCFSEKKAESCHLLGDYLESIKKEFAKAAKVYKMACDDYNYPRSCHSYATHALLGRGLPKENPEEAFQYFTKSCELNNRDSCANAGVMAISTKPEVPGLPNYSKGIQYLEKGCSMGNSVACLYLCGLFISGSKDKKVSKDMTQASKYAKMGCDLDDIHCCSNLSIMFRKGEGVLKDEKKAEEYKKRALDLQQQHNDRLLLNFQREADK